MSESPGLQHRFVDANGIRIHLAEQGSGPLVLLCHGFPESWYSWRYQLRDLSAAGYRVVAPDMRGYGQTSQPRGIDQYTIFHLVGDMVGILDALGVAQAVIVGHDWGAPVAWNSALLRPDRFRAVVGLSVPFFPRGRRPPTRSMPSDDEAWFYQLYFQEPGVAEAEIERDPRLALHKILVGKFGSGSAKSGPASDFGMVRRGQGFIDSLADPGDHFTDWLTPEDLDFYAGEFRRSGFAGGLNWYRNIDRNWELTAPFHGATVQVPALYMAGDRDLVVRFPGMEKLLRALPSLLPRLHKQVMLPGCGHWTQQERAREVSEEIVGFLRGLS